VAGKTLILSQIPVLFVEPKDVPISKLFQTA